MTGSTDTASQADTDVGAGAHLAGADLRDRDLAGRDLTGADLTAADLRGADLTGATLVDARMHDADLRGARFLYADLTGADLSTVRAADIGLGGAVLDRVALFGADLSNASLSNASLKEADLRTAQLGGARLLGSDLTGADATRADFTDADLSGAVLDNTSFHDADLHETRMRGITGFRSVDWVGCNFSQADFTGAYLARREAIDQNYLHEFRSRGRIHQILYWVWWITSDCGRSFLRWGAWTMVFALFFSFLYGFVGIDYGTHETAVSSLYFSVVTLTTLGYGDILPATTAGQLVVMCEVLLGYVMLGGLLSIFATKMGRRGE